MIWLFCLALATASELYLSVLSLRRKLLCCSTDIGVATHDRNCIWLSCDQALSTCFCNHNLLLNLDLFLQEVLNRLDVVNVVWVYVKVVLSVWRSLGIDLVDEVLLILHTSLLSRILKFLLTFPVLSIHAFSLQQNGFVLVPLDLRLKLFGLDLLL